MTTTKGKFPPQVMNVQFHHAPSSGRAVRVNLEDDAGQVKGFDMSVDCPSVDGGFLVTEASLAELIKHLRMSFAMVDRAFDD